MRSAFRLRAWCGVLEDAAVRAVSYVRVSTEDQARGTSLGSQLERTSGYAGAMGWRLVGEYVDGGVSGSSQDRPEFRRLLEDASGGCFDVVVVTKLDRFSRSLQDFANVTASLAELGVGLVSVSESFDSSSATGRLQRNLLALFAEYERELILERMVTGQLAAVRLGRWVGGPAPFGLRVAKNPEGFSVLETDEAGARVVCRIVELVVDEERSSWEAAQILNAEGLFGPRGSRWTSSSLRLWVLNRSEHISGKWTYRPHGLDEVVVEIPALVSVERHEELREAMERFRAMRRRTHRHPLAGRLWSPELLAMTGSKRRGGVSYRCSGKLSRVPGPACGCGNVSAAAIEATVDAALQRIEADPSLIEPWIDPPPCDEPTLEVLRAELDESIDAFNAVVADLKNTGADRELASEVVRVLGRSVQQRQVNYLRATQPDHRSPSEAAGTVSLLEQRLIASDVHVYITGYRPCTTCNQTGITAIAPIPASTSRWERTGLAVCPACRRYKKLPLITLSGARPDRTLQRWTMPLDFDHDLPSPNN